MKKIINIIAIAAISAGAHAASINWNISGLARNLLEHDGKTVAANTSIYLILADTASLATLTAAETASAFTAALGAITVNTTAAKADGSKPDEVADIISTSGLLAAGTTYSFAMIYLSEDALGNGYYKMVTASGAAYAFNPDDASNRTSVSTSWSTMNGASWTKAYNAVPEPATAGLAIAGLALLFKRRRS
jgi:PEP-CTERM putative exosortase interaction domain